MIRRLALSLSLLACSSPTAPAGPDASPPSASASPDASTAPADGAPDGEAAPDAGAADAAPAPLPGRTDGCPDGMVRIEGEYCPGALEICLEHHPDWVKHHGEKGVAERCLRYQEPTRCLSKKRQHLSYCMDRYEYPNVPGERPRVLVSWTQARTTCEVQKKRLCTEPEFHFACEGPDMLPYVYGYVRDGSVCNQDKEYRLPNHDKRLLYYDACLTDPWCAGELARLDQREPIGERKTCVSWAGVFDLNGNVNEWIARPREEAPHRSGLMGGWWGPIRSRCRAITTFHPEHDYGYEVGFRCCADAH